MGKLKHINIDEESGYERKNEHVPEEVMPAKIFTLNELSDIVYNIEDTKDKMLAANPNLERCMTISQGPEKMLHYKLFECFTNQ